MPLIASAARTYRHTSAVDRGELMQEGVVGLLRAVRRYDPELGTPFWAYASWWVRQAMQQLVAEMTRPVVLSDRALRRLARIKDARRAHLTSCGREPSPAQLATATQLAPRQIDRLLAAERPPRGLEESLDVDGTASATVGDMVADPTAQEAFSQVTDSAEAEELRARTGMLDERERGIVFQHYGLAPPAKTLRQIADGLGLSVERVRQIEERALTKLRDAMENPSSPAPSPGELRELPAGERPALLRGRLSRALADEHVPEATASDMLIATHEVAACIWEEGGRPEFVRVGRRGDNVVCEIFDRGPGFERKDRLGLWIARTLATRIEEQCSPAGHTVTVWI
jgi:RNA polymerase sigma factor (sigma-70 family)